MIVGWYSRMLTQVATYWPPSSKDAYGNYSYGSPQSVKCRWEDTQEIFVNYNGEENRSKAIVFVDEVLLNNGYLFLGVSNKTNPTEEELAMLIQKFDSIPSIKGDEYERKAWL